MPRGNIAGSGCYLPTPENHGSWFLQQCGQSGFPETHSWKFARRILCSAWDSDQSNCGVSPTSRQREQTRPSITFPGKSRLMENQHRTPGRQSIERILAPAGDRTCRGLRQRSSPRKWARPRPLPPRELFARTLAGCQNRGAIGIAHLSCTINRPEIVHGVSAKTEITKLSTLNKLEIPRRRTDLCSLFRQWV